MAFQVGKPNITEIQVRMDCNGCVQKIRRAVQTVEGIYKIQEDLPQQKIIVVGWAEPEKMIRAIKKAGKIAKLCSHTVAEEECNSEATETGDSRAASSSSATTVTQDPPEQNNQTVTEENLSAPEAGGPGNEPPPPEEIPVEVPIDGSPAPEVGDPQPQETQDPPVTEEQSVSDRVPSPERYDRYYMNMDHSPPSHRYLIRNGLNDYHVAQEYYREADYSEYTRYNYPDYGDHERRYQRNVGDPYYYNNNGGASSSYGTSRVNNPAADGSRITTMFSDENPNACCIS